MSKILLLDDNERFSGVLAERLDRSGFLTDCAPSIRDFIDLARIHRYAAFIVDLLLPDGDGLELVRRLRATRVQTPILISTVKSGVHARIEGLNAGADDYLEKPYHGDELIARLKAILRRPPQIESPQVRFGALIVNVMTNEILCQGQQLSLRPSEQRLLILLIQRSGKVVAKASIENALQRANNESSPNAIEKTVSRLRRVLEEKPAGIELRTVKGIGYVLQERG